MGGGGGCGQVAKRLHGTDGLDRWRGGLTREGLQGEMDGSRYIDALTLLHFKHTAAPPLSNSPILEL